MNRIALTLALLVAAFPASSADKEVEVFVFTSPNALNTFELEAGTAGATACSFTTRTVLGVIKPALACVHNPGGTMADYAVYIAIDGAEIPTDYEQWENRGSTILGWTVLGPEPV